MQQMNQAHSNGIHYSPFGTTHSSKKDQTVVRIYDKNNLNNVQSQVSNLTQKLFIEIDNQDLSNYKLSEEQDKKGQTQSDKKSSSEKIHQQLHLNQLWLSIKNCKVDLVVLQRIISQLNQIEQLQTLYLYASNNNIYDVGLKSLTQLMFRFNSIKIIQLDFSNSKVANVNSIVESIQGKQLTDLALNFSNNPVQNLDSFKKILFPNIKTLTLELKQINIIKFNGQYKMCN